MAVPIQQLWNLFFIYSFIIQRIKNSVDSSVFASWKCQFVEYMNLFSLKKRML